MTSLVRVAHSAAIPAVAALWLIAGAPVRADDSWLEAYRAAVGRIVAEATSNAAAWTRLAEFTDMFPARLSGSSNLQRAIEWTADQMKRDGLENVRLDKVMVPHWVRGNESAEIVEPFQGQLAITALGGSIGTPADGIKAEAIVGKNLESDNGVLPLKGWGFNGTEKAREVVAKIAGLLRSIGGDRISDRFDGTDVAPAARAGNIPAISPEVDMTRYFVIHHTPADTVDKIDPAEMARCVAAIASMAYVVADMPQTLDRAASGATRQQDR